jgi:hypothetical protein
MCIFHKWEYQIFEEETLFKDREVNVKKAKRICEKCYSKQITKFGFGIYNFRLKKYVNWYSSDITKQEMRDIKLKKLISNK